MGSAGARSREVAVAHILACTIGITITSYAKETKKGLPDARHRKEVCVHRRVCVCARACL